MRTHLGPRIALASAAALLPVTVAAQAPVKICPLGDSIIESFAGQASSRYYLDQLLRAGGYAFDFVGHNYGVALGLPRYSNFDQDHEAYSGWKVDDVLVELGPWVQQTRPDVVLIHLGTVDTLGNQSAASTIAELEQSIDVIRGANPFVTIALSQLMPMATRDVTALNGLMPAMVARKDSAHSRVVLVDHHTPFDLAAHVFPDGVHPNDAGERLFADVWYAALQDLLTPASQEVAVFGAACAGSAPIAPRLEPILGQAASLGSPFTVRFEHVPPGAAPFGLIGFWLSPLDLGAIGAPGCELAFPVEFTAPLTIGGGLAFWTIEIPELPVLVGNAFYQQGLFTELSLNPLGLVLSDAAAVTVVAGS